jgi:outer membrane lipoprotein carrier protein
MTRHAFPALALFLVAAIAHADDPEPPSARSVADAAQGFYDRVDTLEARFDQRYHHRIYQRTQTSSGRLRVGEAGRMRFDYDAPNGKIIVSNGVNLVAYEPGESGAGQYVKTPVSEDGLHSGFAFLTGRARILDDYRVRLLNNERYRWRGHVLELRPRAADPNIRRILLFVDGRSDTFGVVHRVRIDDHEGNQNQLTLRSMRLNRGFGDQAFHFTPPSGARRVGT